MGEGLDDIFYIRGMKESVNSFSVKTENSVIMIVIPLLRESINKIFSHWKYAEKVNKRDYHLALDHGMWNLHTTLYKLVF